MPIQRPAARVQSSGGAIASKIDDRWHAAPRRSFPNPDGAVSLRRISSRALQIGFLCESTWPKTPCGKPVHLLCRPLPAFVEFSLAAFGNFIDNHASLG